MSGQIKMSRLQLCLAESLGFFHIWARRLSWSCDPDVVNKLLIPLPIKDPYENLALIVPVVSEWKKFEEFSLYKFVKQVTLGWGNF